MAKIISSINNEIIKTTYKLLRDQKSQYIIIENINVINPEFCQNNDIHAFFCSQSWYDKNNHYYKMWNNKFYIVNESIINKLSFTKHPQELLVVIKYKYKHFNPVSGGKYFIFEKVNDPGNLGTMLRNAIAFDFCEIFINQNGVCPLNEKVVRSAMGALQQIKINFYSDLKIIVDQLHALNINVFATALNENSMKLNEFKAQNNYAIILGNEAHGIESKYLNYINNNLYIPIHEIESLNVANACAIIMYTLNQLGYK